MTCYQRHLTGLFERLDLTYDKPNRAAVHEALLEALRMPDDAHCPQVWQSLKDTYGPIDENLDVMARDVAAVLSAHD
jgi:hypothetical protein